MYMGKMKLKIERGMEDSCVRFHYLTQVIMPRIQKNIEKSKNQEVTDK